MSPRLTEIGVAVKLTSASPQPSVAEPLLHPKDSADQPQSASLVQAQQLVCSSQVLHKPSLHEPLVSGGVPEQADDDVPSLVLQTISLDRVPAPHDVLQDPHGPGVHCASFPPDNLPE